MLNKENWEQEFNRRFVREDGLMDKYNYYETGEAEFMAESIKSFIRTLLDDINPK